jgi:CheY-like chemotaxis protein
MSALSTTADSPSILVVEDHVMIALDVEMMLKSGGYRVIGPVASVAAALKKIDEQMPDAAVLDANLGAEMVFAVADTLAAARVPFLLLTGHTSDVLPAEHRQRPILNKPFQKRDLLAALGQAMTLSQAA